jgi:hypothetical protein
MKPPKLFHRDVFMPEWIRDQFIGQRVSLSYTRHAQLECIDDNLLQPPFSLFITDVVEAEWDSNHGRVSKITVRHRYDAERDMVLVLVDFNDGAAIVKTCWSNKRSDNHSTLDRKKYATS